ncbi:MAG: hypothetical protein R2705_07060 [Ilumatobacteraceae bacterium]
MLREAESLRSERRQLATMRIVVGHDGGLGSITRAAARHLRSAGAAVVPLDDPDPVVQARTANQFEADVYLGFHGIDGTTSTIVYYAVPAFESVAGRALALHVQGNLTAQHVLAQVEVAGRRIPILRETRMRRCGASSLPRCRRHQGVAIASACCGDQFLGPLDLQLTEPTELIERTPACTAYGSTGHDDLVSTSRVYPQNLSTGCVLMRVRLARMALDLRSIRYVSPGQKG